ncbi:hypothetical protein EKO04_006536 [Ascochyta lentis]|uniref:Suppressor of anucleate metulae protein B n=1 Tax=Ascochyta lentis TaxID=205686 RepID=A0A8H7J3L5_9PLEO|nr:hypothetical protein EKO04_006536 [Ascochyta lentis]
MPWQPCLVCDEETTNYCDHCAPLDSEGTVTNARFYCDIDCQKKDELEHLKVHMGLHHTMAPEMERAIKAGNIAQSLFYAFLENTWSYDMKNVHIQRDQDLELVAVEVTDGTGVVTAPGGHTDCKSCAGGWLIKFPVEAFSAFDEDAKHALLAHRSSVWAFVVMHAAVRALFQDLVEDVQTDIKEIVHYPTEKSSRIVHAQGSFGFETRRRDQLYPDVDERGDVKGVYEITLKCGSKIALDLAGAQWELLDGNGPHQPVTYWADYWTRWGAAIKYCVPFRSHQIKHAAKMTNYRMITSQTLIMETTLYFNVFLTGSCKAELDYHPRELLDMESQIGRSAKQRFLTKAILYIQRRSEELDSGNALDVCDIFQAFDLRHPKVIAEQPAARPRSNGSLPLDIGSMGKFDWKDLSRFIQMPSSEVTFKEKKRAKALQKKRSVYKEPGSWRMVFLEDTIPVPRVPMGCFSENPAWKLD